MITHDLTVSLTVRDLAAEDLLDLEWSGSSEHLRHVAELLPRIAAEEVSALVVAVPSGVLVAMGVADLVRTPGSGLLQMLAVRESWQSLGVGRVLVGALEERIAARGLDEARIGVEHDNPRAAALYRRLGYRACGTELDSWTVGGGQTYVTVNTILCRALAQR